MQWFVVIYLRVAASNAPTMCKQNGKLIYKRNYKLDLAFNNVKPKDWYFVLD